MKGKEAVCRDWGGKIVLVTSCLDVTIWYSRDSWWQAAATQSRSFLVIFENHNICGGWNIWMPVFQRL